MKTEFLRNQWGRFAVFASALFLVVNSSHAALVPASVTTTGSSVTTNILYDSSTVVTFLADGTFTVPDGATARLLLVGGGGAGGNDCSGGGGAGGMLELSNVPLGAGTYTVTVGAGGQPVPGNSNVPGGNGGNTVLSFGGTDLYTAVGGGGGGSWSSKNGVAGGSGGGVAGNGGGTGGAGTEGQGYAAGNTTGYGRSGGGGAGGPSPDSNIGSSNDDKARPGGAGGPGKASDITGVSVYYAGGGGGGGYNCNDSAGQINGGSGGGGNGARNTSVATRQAATLPDGRNEYDAEAGVNGLGGGGGGANNNDHVGRPGGSGVLIVRLAPLASGPEPVVLISGTEDGDRSAVVRVYLASVGDNAQTATVSYRFATSLSKLETAEAHVAAADVPAGTVVPISLTGLPGGKAVYVRIFAENNLDVAATPVDATVHPSAGFDPASFDLFSTFTVTNYAGTDPLTNFPVLVRLSEGSPVGFAYADCAADGSDLRFSDAAGNLIPHEIDTWNPVGESLLWVRVPVATNGAAFKMYYASSVPGVPSSENVWARYAVVIHGGSSIENAIAGGPAVSVGNTTYVKPDAGAGKVGGGIRKSTGNAVAVNVAMGTTPASTTLEDTGKFSVSGWFKRNGEGGNQNNGTHVLAASRPGWENGNGFLWLQEQGKYISVAAYKSHQFSNPAHQNVYVLPNQEWAHAAFTYEKDVSLTSYFDGKLDNQKESPGNLVSSGGVWTFGSYANTGSNDSLIGDMDELRIFDGVASGDWIKAEHDTVEVPSFLAAGAVQPTDPDAPRIAAPAVVEDICRLDVSFSCSVDGATVTYRLAAPGEDPDDATPVVVTASSTADAPLSIPLTGLVGDAVYTIVLEAEKDGHAARPITITASPFALDPALTPSAPANDARTRVGVDEIHTFSASGTFTLATRRRVRFLAVGGGGGAGWGSDRGGGGGGAGGMLEGTNVLLQAGSYRYEVGAGGAPGKSDAQKGGTGGDTVLFWTNPATGAEVEVFRAFGGGGSGCFNWGSANYAGNPGGSGGGGIYRENNQYGAAGAGTTGQGHDGGGWTTNPGTVGASGGGGAGAPGETGTATKGGDGGDGRPSDITGAEVWYAGGGGGATRNNDPNVRTPGMGGKGGGGRGADYGIWAGDPALDGADGLGGGGGGGLAWYANGGISGWRNCFGGRGGSGTLVLRFIAAPQAAPAFASASAAVTDRTVATFSGTVEHTGDGAATADLVLTLGGVSETVATGLKQGDSFSVEKTVERGASVAWSLKLVNALSAESAAESGTLAVPADAPVAITATGASRVFSVGTDTVAVFTNTAAAGSLVVPEEAWVEILVVGGGGAGGRARSERAGGGGGAGGFVYEPALRLAAGTYSIAVGAGGKGREGGEKQNYGHPGQNGGDSAVTLGTADVLRAYGGSGGAGGHNGNLTNVLAIAGSTGGAQLMQTSNIGWIPVAANYATAGQGHDGGASAKSAAGYGFPGGGGGAGAPGGDADATTPMPGAGGDGLPCSITGEEVWYAGGGGGGAGRGSSSSVNGVAAAGGKGGGGHGQRYQKETSADCRGVDGLGGGGGGGAYYNDDDNLDSSCTGHSGGCGTVIVRWRTKAVTTIEIAPDEPAPGLARGTFSGTVDAVGADGETVTVEIGLCAAGSAATNWTTVATGLAAGGTYSAAIDGLANNTAYTAAWRATNGAGASETGDAGSFTTLSGAYLVPGAASEGATVTQVGQDSIYTYSNPATASTFVVATPGYARVLLAGGGGAGGWSQGGGGGGGGVIEEELVWFEAGTYAITVGAGGTPSTGNTVRGGAGGDSVVSLGGAELWRAFGGGGGGSWNDNAANASGGSGGSGGGGTYRNGRFAGKAIDPAQGHDGAPGLSYENSWDRFSPGGGGGAGGPGVPALEDHTVPGAGGPGRVSDISGSAQQYGAGGGAGGPYNNRALGGVGGDGIGGHGRRRDEPYWSGDEAGRDGYGGGGGGGNPNGSNDDNNASFNRRPGAAGGCGTVIIRFTGSAPEGLPDAAAVAAAPAAGDPTAAAVQVLVRSLGGAASATLELAYGASRANLPLRHAVGTVTAAGTIDTTLSGLEPGKTYYVAAAIRTAAGETVTRAVEVTLPPAGAVGGEGAAGLWQAQVIGDATSRDPDLWDAVTVKGVVAGTIAAIGTGDAVDPFTGTSYDWAGVPSMFVYKGAIFLTGGTTYTFGSRMDDSVYLKIGDTAVLDVQANPAHSAFADFTAPWTGWYPIDVRLGNAIGDRTKHGPDGDGATSWTSFALAFNTEGSRTMMPESAWTTLIDPGDGSFLRTEVPGLRYSDLDVNVEAQNQLRVTTAVAPGDTAVHAYLCSGPSWGGNAPADWATTADLGEVAAADAATALDPATVAGWGSDALVAAVALVHPDGTVTWSTPATYAATALVSLSAAATDWSQGDELEVSFTVAGGTGPYAVQLRVGSGPGSLSRAAQTTLAAPGTGTLKATGLVPGQTYYWQVVVTDANGASVSSDASASVLMPSGAVYLNEAAGIAWSVDQRTPTLTGGLKALGAGDNWAYLYVYEDPYLRWGVINPRDFRGNTTNSGIRVQLTDTGLFTLTHEFPWETQIGFNWVVSNSNGRVPWITSRMPDWNGNEAGERGYFWNGDFQTYAWNGGEGVWTDPAMWTGDGTMEGHEQRGFPITGSYATFPAGDHVVTIPAGGTKVENGVAVFRPTTLKLQANAHVTIRGTPESAPFNLQQINPPLRQGYVHLPEGARLVLSGVKGSWYPQRENGSSLYCNGPNTLFEVTDGSEIEIGGNGVNQWTVNSWNDGSKDGRRFVFSKGSRTTVRGEMLIAGRQELVVDDATLAMEENAGSSDYSRIHFGFVSPGRFVLRGAHPLVLANNSISVDAGTNPSSDAEQFIDFEIPAGGFVETPIRCRADNTTYLFGRDAGSTANNTANRKMILRVPTNSPVATAKGVLDQPLVWWPAGKTDGTILSSDYLPHPDTDYWYDTFDPVSGTFTGWGVHIVGRPDVAEPQVVGLAVTNVVSGAADLFFYGIPGTNAASATFSATLERVDLPSDTSAALVLTGGTAGSVAQGTRFTIAATGLAEGGVYRITVTGEDDGDSSLTCSETVFFNALADYAEASTSSTGATAVQDGPYTVWTFTDATSEGVLTVTRPGTARILVVGGGGSGGGGDSTATNEGDTRRGGGGGGGGEVVESEVYLQPGDYFVTVGAGGASVGSYTVGKAGGYSTFAGLVTAYGGGGGGGRAKRNDKDGSYVDAGANGGGAAGQGAAGGAATAVGGHAGGVSTYNGWAKWTDVYAGAGGGSMGGIGGDAGLDALNMLAPGNGADGVPSDITGSVVYYGGGGGGGGASYAFGPGIGGLGGKGGGGEGRSRRTCTTFALESSQGADGFGGGGGGGSSGGTDSNCPSELQAYRSGRGGSGAVIVRMRTATARMADPQIVLRSAEPTAGGLDLTVGVHSLGNGESSADLLFVATADGAGAATTNALGTVAATGDASFSVAGLKPGTDYTGALVATNAAGGIASVAVPFRTAGDYHGDADSGVVAGTWMQTDWIENDPSLFRDNLLRASNGTSVRRAQNRCKNDKWGSAGSDKGGWEDDMIDGILNRTNGRWVGYGTNDLLVFTLAAPSAVSSMRFFAGWGSTDSWTPIAIEAIDVRSGANEEWTTLPNSAYQGALPGTWGCFATLDAGGNDWLARDVRQIRVRFDKNLAKNNDGTRYWEIEAQGAAEADAPAIHARSGVGRPLSVASTIRTATALSAVASALAGAPAFTDVIAVWGAAHAGEDTNAWDHARSIGAMGEAASSLATTLTEGELAGTVYLRFCGVGADGTVSWSDTVYVPELEEQTDVPPVVVFGTASSSGASAVVEATVVSAGSLATEQAVDVTLEYTRDPDGFSEGWTGTPETFAFADDAAIGAIPAVTVAPLHASRRYYARLVARNNAGQTGTSDVFTFETTSGASGEIAAEGGLLQQRCTGVSNGGNIAGARAMVWDETKAELVEGALAAYTTGSFGSAKSGNTYAWGDNVGFIYRGFIRLEGGVQYTFRTYLDDTCEITIDGTAVLTQGSYGDSGPKKFTKETTGWYPIQIIMSNGSGGAGGVNSFGIGWSADGKDALNADNMNRLVDPGDGSFLRPRDTRTLVITAADASAGSVTVAATASAGNPTGTAWAVWGAADLGEESAVSAWTGSQSLGPVGPDDTTIGGTLAGLDPAATPIVRVAIVPTAGGTLWSSPVVLDAGNPLIGPVEGAAEGDTLAVSGSMLSLGTDVGFTLQLQWSYAEDFAGAGSTNLEVAANGSFAGSVGVRPDTNGWWRLVARTTDGGFDMTLPVAFDTEGGSVLKQLANATVSHHAITANGTLEALGAGTTTVTLWAGSDENSLAAVPGSSKVLTTPGAFSVTGIVPGDPHLVYWKIVSENVAPGGTKWTSETPVYTITTEDTATYTWKLSSTEGDWNDPANWTVSGTPDVTDCLGYPNHAKAAVKFLAGTEATVNVPAGTWAFSSMDLNVNPLHVTFVGEGAAATTISGNVWGAGDTSAWTDWNVVFDNLTVYESNSIQLGGKTSRDSTLRLQNGAVLSLSGWQDIRGTNNWIEAVGGSQIYWRDGDSNASGFTLFAAEGGVRLEDSTANPPCVCYERGNGANNVGGGAKPGDQTLVLSGASVLRVRNYFRPYSESEDGGFGALTLSFSVPKDGWTAGVNSPVYANYLRGSSDNKMFAWRSVGKEVPVILEVSKDSPLLKSGRHRTVQLLEWNAGIDTNNVTLTDREGYVHMYYTYGFPQVRTTPTSEGEIPTGVAADIRSYGTFIMIR